MILRKANKNQICDDCYGIIEKGSHYYDSNSNKFKDEHIRVCLNCYGKDEQYQKREKYECYYDPSKNRKVAYKTDVVICNENNN